MNLVLIGYRGTGKSVVGRLLARKLNMDCVSMDAAIVEKTGMSIPEIVDKFGWVKFRDLESEVVRELSSRDNIIIDSGGGVIERSENVETLKSRSVIFWLNADIDVIVARISRGSERPALTEGKSFTAEVEEVLAARLPKYRAAAHHEIDTGRITPGRTAEAIADIWNKRN
jgi:shikimate kinase